MKPHEQEWEYLSGDWPHEVWRKTPKSERVVECWGDHEDCDLIAAAPDLVRALLAVEVNIGYEEATCASCQAPASYDHIAKVYSIPKHEPDCGLDAALRKAGVR